MIERGRTWMVRGGGNLPKRPASGLLGVSQGCRKGVARVSEGCRKGVARGCTSKGNCAIMSGGAGRVSLSPPRN